MELSCRKNGCITRVLILVLSAGVSLIQLASSTPTNTAGLDTLVSNSNYCPDGCRCDETTLDVTCRNVDFSLGDFYRLPPWTKVLTLSRASIPTLFDRSFVTLRNLTSLTIQNSDLKSVQPNALMALQHLEILQLPSNQLTQLPGAFFANTPNIRQISLTDNLINGLPDGLFDHCHQIRVLRLDQNSIRSLPGSQFIKLGQLEELHLSSNLLQEMPANFLTSPSLRFVDVSFNAIRFVSPDSLISVPELTTLNLSHNLLTHVNPVSLMSARKLTRVGLDHNPLICDCQLAPLRAYWTSVFSGNSGNGATLFGSDSPDSASPTCAWPLHFNGIPIAKLGASDFICTTTTTPTTSTSTTTTVSTSTTTRALTTAKITTKMPTWLFDNNTRNPLDFSNQPSFDASVAFGDGSTQPPLNQVSSLPPVEIIAASVASVIAVMVTLSIVLAFVCYRRRKLQERRKQTRSIVVSTTPKRFNVGLGTDSCDKMMNPAHHLFTTSTPCAVGRGSGDVEKLGADLLSSASSASSSGSASPPSGSTSIPSSHNCIFSTQQSAAFQMMPDGGLAVIGSANGSNGGLVQTVIDHLDYTSGVLIGAPHTFSLSRHHHHYPSQGTVVDSSTLPGGNIIVDMTSLLPTSTGTIVRSESLV